MSGALNLTVTLLCLVTGGLMLVHALRNFSTGQLVTRRFREHVADARQIKTGARELMVRFGRGVAGGEPLGDLRGLLLQAGIMNPVAPFMFVAVRLVVALMGAGLMLVKPLLHTGIGARDAAFAFFFGFIVYRGFTIALKLRIEARQREIRRELPYVLDLLLMVLDAGVSVDQALTHVASQIADVAPVTALLLNRYIAETEDGLPYDKALERLAERMAIPEGRDFAGLLKQNLYQGGELSPPLRRLATDIGEARLANARETMGKKSVLLTLAMLAFFMPVLMIALAGPAVSDLVGTLGRVAHDLDNQRIKR